MQPTRLYLVRHGATDMTAEDRFSGRIGDLSDVGRRQIGRLAERLRGERIQALYASPLQRTLDSARIIGAAIGLEPILREDLREIDHGRWEGLTHAEARALHPAEFAAWLADPYDRAPVGGESAAAVLARAMPVIRQILADETGKRVLVVTHKATLRLVVCELLGIDPRGYRDRLEQSPASLDVFEVADGAPPKLLLFNETRRDGS